MSAFYKLVSGDSGALGEQDVAVCRSCGGADAHTDSCLVPAFEAELENLHDEIDELRAKLRDLTDSDTIKSILRSEREEAEAMAAEADARSY